MLMKMELQMGKACEFHSMLRPGMIAMLGHGWGFGNIITPSTWVHSVDLKHGDRIPDSRDERCIIRTRCWRAIILSSNSVVPCSLKLRIEASSSCGFDTRTCA